MKNNKTILVILAMSLILLYAIPAVTAQSDYSQKTASKVKYNTKYVKKPVWTPTKKPTYTPKATCTPTPPPNNCSKIKGLKYVDTNRNCKYDACDARLPGVCIKLYNAQYCLIAQTYTDHNGYYCFGNLGPGCYYVSEVVPPGYTNTTPSTVSVYIPNCCSTLSCCFGNVPVNGNNHFT